TVWSHERGSMMREQAHGSPGNLLDLYAAADNPETESFGPLGGPDANPLIFRFASSAAHVAGRLLASAEAFTWLGEHFSTSLDEIKRAADQLFLAGINHLVYHGTAYSPADASWPGWEFYASSEFNPRNAWWRDLPAFNAYVTRVQSVLQEGRADNDVLLYWPIWDSWHDPSGLRVDFRVHDPRWLSEMPVGAVARALAGHGYGFDYVSDRLLRDRVTASAHRLSTAGGSYATLVVPRTQHMPPETLERMLALARDGATVIFVGGLPSDVPGLTELAARRARLARAVQGVALPASPRGALAQATVGRGRVLSGDCLPELLAAAHVMSEPLASAGRVQLMRRRRPDGCDYFIVNSDSVAVNGWVPLAVQSASVLLMDPMTGHRGLAERRAARATTEIRLQLAPGESRIVRTFDAPVSAPRWRYETPSGSPSPLSGRWAVRFLRGGPALPASFMSDSLAAWTGRGDADADRFAGTARYSLRFDAPNHAADFLLDLGGVAESARIRLNGKELGVLVARPFRLRTGALRPRGNLLEVDVTNLSANRVRDLDRRHVTWKIFHDINYVGIDYKPFDASAWPVRASGLLGPVTITPLQRDR
ncbi:MAG: glycosyl hydrolase, partial [Gemmatimonadaceae bacterium]